MGLSGGCIAMNLFVFHLRAPATEVVENESLLQLKRPCSVRWNSVYDAGLRLNKITELKGPQALCNIC